MKKLIVNKITVIIILLFIVSCSKDNGGNNNGNGGGGGNGNTTGQAIFWTATDLGCGNITVNCNGISKVITGYYTGGAPNCGDTYGANFTLNPGTYSFTASCNGTNWSGSITITAGICSTMQLTGGGGSTGGGSNTGQAMFWIASDLSCGNISVTCNGTTKTITSYYSSGAPNCGASGTASFTLNQGTYNYSASCSGLNWNGTVTVSANSCSKVQLTSGGGGGGTNCNWSSAISCISVIKNVGTRCGDPQSVEIIAKNNCNQNIKIFVCIQKSDGTWQGLPDGTFNTGTPPNGTTTQYVCKGTGLFKVFAMPITSFNSNNCSYPSCN